MAIKILESFDDDLYGDRAFSGNFAAPNASYGLHGKGITLGDTPGTHVYIPLDGSQKQIFGFAIYIANPESGTQDLGYIGSTANPLLYDGANQRIEMRIANNSVGGYWSYYTDIGSVKPYRWHYFEMKFTASTSSAGTMQMGVDGNYTTETTGIDWYYSYGNSRLGWSTINYIAEFYIDDFYVADTTGGVNDDFLGPIAITVKLPNGNGTYSNLTGSDGNSTDNYLLVDEAPPDDGTTYVESGTEGDKDTYAFEDVSGTPNIIGAVASMYAQRTQTGVKYVRSVARVNSTDYTGSTLALPQGYSSMEEVYDVNPNTSTAWTATTFNGAEFGPEVRDS